MILPITIALLALAAAACGGGGSGASPTPSEAPTPTATTRPPTTPGPPPNTAYRLVFREFGQTYDIIWSVSPLDLSQRLELAVIGHREGYGVNPALSPNGKRIAYLTLPDYAQDANSSQAELWLFDIEAQSQVKLAEGLDLSFTPLWSPDGKLIYTRSLAGPEPLAADVRIVRFKAPAARGERTPTPTPEPSPGQTPAPTPDPFGIVLSQKVSQVLNFIPVGFADDKQSMFFVQVQGGTAEGTLLGILSPATADAVQQVEQQTQATADAIRDAYNQAVSAALAAGLPTPEPPTPVPTPTPASKFVVQLSDHLAFDYALSPDKHKLAFLRQEFVDGDIFNRAYVADLVSGEVKQLPSTGLPTGHHLRPVWYPDGRLVAIGVMPQSSGPSTLVLVAADGSEVDFLAQPESGFDEPRGWAPDGSWLAIAHHDGDSIANPGPARLMIVAETGQRSVVIEGSDNATEDSVLGWTDVVPALPTPGQ